MSSLQLIAGWKILVVDQESLSVLDATCKMSEILGENVTVVEGLGKKRQPNPDKNAVYFIAATLSSVSALLADFDKRPMYASCHVFCLSALSDSLFDRIKQSPARQFMKTLRELNIDFTAPDPNYFSLDTPESFFPLFNPQASALLDYEIDTMAKKIVSVLVNLGEYPHIRYHSKPQAFSTTPQKSLSFLLAQTVQRELDEVCRVDRDFPPSSSYERAILVIGDRSLDVHGLFLHDLHYEGMLADLGTLHKSKFVDEKDGKDHVLDEADAFWAQSRTMHISEVMELVTEKFQKFQRENKAAQWEQSGGRGPRDGSGDNIEHLKDVMNSFGDYQATKESVSRHMNLCLGVSNVFAKRNLEGVVEVEQNLAIAESGDSKFNKLVKSFNACLGDVNIEYYDKVRLILLYIASQEGVSDGDRQKMLELARLEVSDIQALTNLSMLGVRLSPVLDKRKSDVRNPYSHAQMVRRTKEQPAKYENAKYVPVVNYIIQDQVNSKLDSNWFPWLKDPPPALDDRSSNYSGTDSATPAPLPQRKKPSWATRKANTESQGSVTPSQPAPKIDLRQNGPRVIFFMIGGVTYSELRAVTQLQADTQRELIIGSTHMWTPDSAVEALKELGKRNVQGARFYGFHRPVDHRVPAASPSRDQYQDEPRDRYKDDSRRMPPEDRRIPARPSDRDRRGGTPPDRYQDRGERRPPMPPPREYDDRRMPPPRDYDDRRGQPQYDIPPRPRYERSNSSGYNGAPNPSLMARPDGYSRGSSGSSRDGGSDRYERSARRGGSESLNQDMAKMNVDSRGDRSDGRKPSMGREWLRRDDSSSDQSSAPEKKKGWFGF